MTNALAAHADQARGLPAGARRHGHYVAALQTKPGEFNALINASPETWAHLTPLIEIVGPKGPGAEPFTENACRGLGEEGGRGSRRASVLPRRAPSGTESRTGTEGGQQPVLSVIHGAARNASWHSCR